MRNAHEKTKISMLPFESHCRRRCPHISVVIVAIASLNRGNHRGPRVVGDHIKQLLTLKWLDLVASDIGEERSGTPEMVATNPDPKRVKTMPIMATKARGGEWTNRTAVRGWMCRRSQS
uniref:Uncharacterized protein n=1 Tax=Oryza nivara TaxID=4536 RepID=A0A0E0J0E9_ORYNI